MEKDAAVLFTAMVGLFFFVAIVGATPDIAFLPPTPGNATEIETTTADIVASTTDVNDTSTFVDLDSDLLNWWAMDYYNDSGIFDNSTHGYFLKFKGGLNYSNLTVGARGYGLKFDGVNDYLEGNTSITTNSTFTFNIWFQNTNLSAQGFIALYSGSGTTILLIRRDAGNPKQWFPCPYNLTGTAMCLGGSTLNSYDNQIYMATVVHDGHGQMKSYINGTLVNTASMSQWGSMRLNTMNMTYVRLGYYSAQPFNGTLDEGMLSLRNYSDAEVAALYNSSAHLYIINLTELTEGTQYNYTTWAVDADGNVNSSSRYFIVNLTPDLWFTLPASNNTHTPNENYVFINVSGDENLSACALDMNQTVYACEANVGSGKLLNGSKAADCLWTTPDVFNFYGEENYTKPFGATSAIYTGACGGLAIFHNYTVDSVCFQQNPIQMRYNGTASAPYLHAYCFNSSTWVDLGLDTCAGSNQIWETAMWFTTENTSMAVTGSSCNINITDQANNTVLDFRVYGNDNTGKLNVTEWRRARIGNTCDTCNVACSENCTVDTPLDCSPMTITGTGKIFMYQDVHVNAFPVLPHGCRIVMGAGKRWWSG